jgi:hypothetical protein
MKRFITGAIVVALLGGCDRGDATGTIDRDRFITTVVQLRQAALETAGDPAAWAARREAILRANRVTEAALREYVAVHGRDVEHMAEVWGAVNERLGAGGGSGGMGGR